MLHRLIFTLSLILSFGFAQIGAVSHEISHYSDATALNQQPSLSKQNSAKQSFNKNSSNNPAQHNPVCEKCVSYAELGHVISGTHVALISATVKHLFINNSLTKAPSSKPRHYRARAPPTLI